MNLEILNGQVESLLVKIACGETFMDAIRDDMYSPDNVKDSGVTIRTNVRNGQALIIEDGMPNAESFPFMDLEGGDCKPEACEVDGSIRAPVWQLGLLGCDTTICLLKLPELMLEFFGDYRFTDADLTNGAVQQRVVAYIQSRFIENQKLADKRGVFFSDLDSPSPFLNGIDGVFKRLSAEDNFVPITNNAEATYAEQAMTFDEVVAILDEQYMLLAEKPGFVETNYEFRMTNFMAMAYYRGLRSLRRSGEDLPEGCCLNINDFTGVSISKDNLAFEGVPIKIDYDWDYLIENMTVLNGGGGAAARVNPNISLLARRGDIYLGTTKETRIGSNKLIVDEVNNVLIMRGLSYLGALIPFAERVSLAM